MQVSDMRRRGVLCGCARHVPSYPSNRIRYERFYAARSDCDRGVFRWSGAFVSQSHTVFVVVDPRCSSAQNNTSHNWPAIRIATTAGATQYGALSAPTTQQCP